MMKNSYWQERVSEVAQELFDEHNEILQRKLLKLYQKSMKQITKEVELLYYKLLEDTITRTDIWSYKHYQTLSKKLSILLAELGAKEETLLNQHLEESLKAIYKRTVLPKANSMVLNEMVIKQLIATSWSEKHFSQAIWDNKAKMIETLKTTLSESIVLGKSKDKAVESIMKKCNVGFRDADRLVRTELMHMINEGQKRKYKDAGYTKVKVLVADDERLCEDCMQNDGKVFDLNEVSLPQHPFVDAPLFQF